MTSECSNVPCVDSVYQWWLQKKNDGTDTLEDVTIFPNMTSTALNASNMIIKKDVLPSNTKFTLKLIVTSQSGSQGFGVLDFETAGAPHSGHCTPSVSEGVALETEFIFECLNWADKSKPLSYEFRIGDDPISYGNSPKSVSTVLPNGKPEDQHRVQITIIVKNFVGVAVTETVFVKVFKKTYISIFYVFTFTKYSDISDLKVFFPLIYSANFKNRYLFWYTFLLVVALLDG